MTEPITEGDLREIPKRPFGVYVIVLLLVLGVAAAVLEIIRTQTGLTGIWVRADEVLRDLSGLVLLASRLFENPLLLTIAHGVIIFVWVAIIIGMWFMRRWAWLLLMVFTGLTLTFALLRYFEGDADYFGMLTNVAIAFYLNDHNVQRAYARRARGATP